MSTLNVRLDDDLEQRLEAEAQRLGLRRSDIVRVLLRRSLPPAGQARGLQRLEQVRSLIGAVDSGVDDLGTDHERHLREGFAADEAAITGHRATRRPAGPARSQS